MALTTVLIHNLVNFKKFQTEALKLPCNSSNSSVSSPSLQISSVCEFAYGWLIQWDYMCGVCLLFSFLHPVSYFQASSMLYVLESYVWTFHCTHTFLIYLRWWTCWLFLCFAYCSTAVAINIQICFQWIGHYWVIWQDFAQNYLTSLLNGYHFAFAVVTIINTYFQGFYYYYYSCPNECKTVTHCGIGLHLRKACLFMQKDFQL